MTTTKKQPRNVVEYDDYDDDDADREERLELLLRLLKEAGPDATVADVMPAAIAELEKRKKAP